MKTSTALSISLQGCFWWKTLWMFVILLRAHWQMSISCCGLHHYLPVLSINEHYHPIVGWQLQHVLRRNKQLNEAHSNFTCHQRPRHDWLHSLMHKFMRLLHMMEYAWLKEVMDSRAAKNGHHLDSVRTFFTTTPSAFLYSMQHHSTDDSEVLIWYFSSIRTFWEFSLWKEVPCFEVCYTHWSLALMLPDLIMLKSNIYYCKRKIRNQLES